ncbi:benzoate transporter [Paenibacillus cremeus]|uniref:Benzoate transporter n=2 Tax=Paenibacillus cremeus TaxID=2163881 RepID=A0A559K0G0_9BACL|nr:benzoate transporter [Paenibacillus cremeus]
MSALMACTGGAIMLIYGADKAGFSQSELISWFFAVYFLGGILNLGLSIFYKIPFGGAHSITAAAFLTTGMAQFSLNELAGCYIMSGLLIALFGFSGLFNRILELIPKQLIDAMLAGLVLKYVIEIVPAFKEIPLIGGMAVLGFFITPKISSWVPPLLGVLIFGIVGLFIGYDFPVINQASFSFPQMVTPIFSMHAFFSITIPVAVLVLSNDIAVGLTALQKHGFKPPVNHTLIWTGFVTMVAALFGGHAVNVGGMMTALCSSEEAGAKNRRYWAAIYSGALVAIFGLVAWKAVVLIKWLPTAFISLISGFTLLGVLLSSLRSAFADSSYRYSSLFSFLIAAANAPFIGISAPVWSLLIGGISAKILGESIPPKKKQPRKTKLKKQTVEAP